MIWLVREILYRLPIRSCLFCPWQSERIFLFKKERRLIYDFAWDSEWQNLNKEKFTICLLTLLKSGYIGPVVCWVSFSFKITKMHVWKLRICNWILSGEQSGRFWKKKRVTKKKKKKRKRKKTKRYVCFQF